MIFVSKIALMLKIIILDKKTEKQRISNIIVILISYGER